MGPLRVIFPIFLLSTTPNMSALTIMRTRFQTFMDELKACALTTPQRNERENPANLADWGRRYAKVKV